MRQQTALVQAICAAPDDDALRLVYADWLEEHGDEARAAFVRVQVRLAATPEYDRAHQEDLFRERSLFVGGLGSELRAALPGLPEGIGWAGHPFTFRRGLAWGVTAADVPTFLRHAEALFALAPVQHLELDGRRGDLGAGGLALLAASPWLARLRSLELCLGRLDAEPIRRLGESPHALSLRRLAFRFAGILPAGVPALVATPLFPRLEELDFSHSGYEHPLGPVIPAALAGVTADCRLSRLNLHQTRCGPGDVYRLAGTAAVRGLTDLDVSGCHTDYMLRAAGFQAMAESPNLARLHTLAAAKTEPQLGGVRALLGSTTITGLRSLDLGSNRLGPKVGQVIANAPLARGLTVLRLGHNDLGDGAVAALARSPHLAGLATLELGSTGIGDEGARALLASPNLAGLVHLDLYGNPISPAVKQALKTHFRERVAV
jgi:uncharacterized protein (TIGR02996 family)